MRAPWALPRPSPPLDFLAPPQSDKSVNTILTDRHAVNTSLWCDRAYGETADIKETFMSYVDGVVIPVPTGNKQKFIDHSRTFDSVFLEHGATRVLECWGDDVKEGKQTDFRRAVQAKADETVVFSWVEWPDKATRDAGMTAIMNDGRMRPESNPMPFDGKRMIFGGFSPVIELQK